MNQCFPEIRRQRWAYRKILQPPWTWEALLHSQNQISYGFLSNAASSVSLNSLLFASTDSLHWTKIQEWNLITIESVLPRRPGMRAHAAKDGIRVLFCCHTFLRICRIRSDISGPREVGEGNQEPVYRDSWFSFCQSYIPAGIFAIYMTDGNQILPWSFRISFSIHLYCIRPFFLQPAFIILSNAKKSDCYTSTNQSVEKLWEYH